MTDPSPLPPVPAWLRFWAVLTLCAALPLVLLGAEVTTKKVGMVDDVGFRVPWHLFTVSLQERGLGYVVEHGHRLAGFVVGLFCIVLAVGLTVAARGALYRSLGWAALAAVGLQGLLGIFRVDLNATFGPSLALVHGGCAQLAIATLVTVAVMTSRTWCGGRVAAPPFLRRGGLALCLLVYIQIVFGAITRHLLDPIAQRLHVLLAFIVLGTVFWLVASVRRSGADRPERRWSYLLAALVCLQPIFGVEAWVRRFGSGILPELVPSSFELDLARSGHHVLGTLIFAITVVLAVLLLRPAVSPAATSARPTPVDAAVRPVRRLEGAV